MEEFERNMKQYIEAINTSPVDESVAFVHLDGHRMKIRTDRGVKIYTLYLAIGLSVEGKKSLLYAGIEEGQERASTWAQILKLLVGRGLKKPLMFITDDLSGLSRQYVELSSVWWEKLCPYPGKKALPLRPVCTLKLSFQ